jgi:ABC-type phosphate transport system ATPase subunit
MAVSMDMNATEIKMQTETESRTELAINTAALNLWYGTFQALFDVNLEIKKGRVTSMIGPSGCGKSTFLRSVNRINERLGYVRIDGSIDVFGNNIYAPEVELVSGPTRYRHRFARISCSATSYIIAIKNIATTMKTRLSRMHYNRYCCGTRSRIT